MSNPDPQQPAFEHSAGGTTTTIRGESRPETCEPACEDGLFPIRAVSSITGVNPITLRAWERRYNLIRPTRTATGHRLYSAADIQEIQRILALSAQGIGFTQIAQILARESRLAENHQVPADHLPLAAPELNPELLTAPRTQGKGLIESLKQAIIHMDPLALRRIEQQAMMWLPPEQVMRSILIEAYRKLEQRESWPDRDLGLHWFGHHVRQRLEWWLLQQAKKPAVSHPLVLIDTTTDHRPLYSNECQLIMALAGKCTVQLITATLSEPQRARLVNRWQAQHWIRLLEPSEPRPDCPGDLLSGSTRLHWCQIISDEQALSITPNGVCQGGLTRCQRYLLEQIA
ncbi:MAG: MerR family transcriptional regulator [Halothiobacillus sp.]|nr:MerR family transcriptional regulator [Halothiobacillus sp.]